MKRVFYSQHLDVRQKKWRSRSCGIAALKMAMDHLKPTSISLDELIKIGLAKKAYIPGIGWSHKGLVKMSAEFGFRGRNFDWAKYDNEIAFEKMKNILKTSPIVASIHKNLDPGKGGHLVFVLKDQEGNIFYADPDAKTRNTILRSATEKKFGVGWKKRIIVLGPAKIGNLQKK